SDIYTLGVLLYEVFTGDHPFADLEPAERLARQLSAPLPPLRARRPDLPVALDAVIQRATAKAPADRYSDVGSLIVEWERASAPGTPRSLARADEQATAPDLMPRAPDGDATTRAAEYAITLTDLTAIENPYKGLRAFMEADAADFFGRAALT